MTAAAGSVRWVEELPERARKPEAADHRLIAGVLLARPGVWAALPSVAPNLSTAIRRGLIRAYLPAGAFQAVSRSGVLHVRYVGLEVGDR